MKNFFTREFSSEVLYIGGELEILQPAVNLFFENRNYGESSKVIYIGLFCMSDKFQGFLNFVNQSIGKMKKHIFIGANN
jgi:hypothetical protein